jgi:hypothetical protein
VGVGVGSPQPTTVDASSAATSSNEPITNQSFLLILYPPYLKIQYFIRLITFGSDCLFP